MDANHRARHTRAEAETVSRLRDAADHRPDERRLSLLVDPGMEVVRDERVLESRLLRLRRVADQVERHLLLARERVADRGHRVQLSLAAALPPLRPAAFFC